MARSKIWKYYDKLDLQTAQCVLCEKIIKTCGNTSNLMKHMKTHPQIDVNDHESIVVRGMLKREPNPFKTRRKLLKYDLMKIKSECKQETDADANGEVNANVNIIELVDNESHAAVESVVNEETYATWAAGETESGADTVSAEDIIEFEPKVAQEQNDQVTTLYHMQNDSLASMEWAVSNGHTSPQNAAYLDNFAYFVCRDKQPLDILQGEGFKQLVQILCPLNQIPNVQQLQERISHKAQLQTALLRQKFGQLQTLSLSCTINTNCGVGSTTEPLSYLEVAAHYHEGVYRRSRTLSAQALPSQYNASNIVDHLQCVCQRFDINKSKIMCIVTRSSRLLEDAVVSLIGNQRHIPCFAHLLQTLLEAVTQRQEFAAICDKVRRCVAYQLSTCSSSASYSTQLQLDTPGRAVSSYEMLESYVRHTPQLHKLDAPPMLNPSELQLAAELLDVLAPLVGAVRQLCGSSVGFYPSASNALPIAYTVLNELKQPENAQRQRHQMSYDMRLFVIRQLEDHFDGMEKNVQMAMTSLLDPRFRNMPFQNASLVAKYMTHLYDLYMERGDSPEEETSQGSATEATNSYDLWSAYRAFSHEKYKHISMHNMGEHQDEISSYFCTNISSLQAEPLLLWKDLSQFHPFLHSLAKKYLHIPATAIPPARLFTAAGAEVLSQHSKLFGDHMSNMLLMADSTLEEWQL